MVNRSNTLDLKNAIFSKIKNFASHIKSNERHQIVNKSLPQGFPNFLYCDPVQVFLKFQQP
jgi:hypothetical protein